MLLGARGYSLKSRHARRYAVSFYGSVGGSLVVAVALVVAVVLVVLVVVAVALAVLVVDALVQWFYFGFRRSGRRRRLAIPKTG